MIDVRAMKSARLLCNLFSVPLQGLFHAPLPLSSLLLQQQLDLSFQGLQETGTQMHVNMHPATQYFRCGLQGI